MLLILSSFVVNSLYIQTGHKRVIVLRSVIQGRSRRAKIKGTSNLWWQQIREDAVSTSTRYIHNLKMSLKFVGEKGTWIMKMKHTCLLVSQMMFFLLVLYSLLLFMTHNQ